jgi:hypothetical protein
MSRDQSAYLDKRIHDMLSAATKLPENFEPDRLDRLRRRLIITQGVLRQLWPAILCLHEYSAGS